VSIPFAVADVRELTSKVAATFDAVIACDNALPHLTEAAELLQAVQEMAGKLRPGGLFLARTRDYDTLLRERPQATPVRVHGTPPSRRAIFQVCGGSGGGRTYWVNQFFVVDGESEWQLEHHLTLYRALLREEFAAIIRQAGLAEVRWYLPEESGYY